MWLSLIVSVSRICGADSFLYLKHEEYCLQDSQRGCL